MKHQSKEGKALGWELDQLQWRKQNSVVIWEPQDMFAVAQFDPFENGQENIPKLTQNSQLQEECNIYQECCLGEDGLTWLDHSAFILQDWDPKLELLKV